MPNGRASDIGAAQHDARAHHADQGCAALRMLTTFRQLGLQEKPWTQFLPLSRPGCIGALRP